MFQALFRLLPILLLLGACAEPEVPTRVLVEGNDFQWTIRYPGADGLLGTPDDPITHRNPLLPANRRVTIELRSRDLVYSFGLPALELREIAVPELSFEFELPPQSVGTLVLKGDQMCGFQHPNLIAEVRVLPPRQFQRRLAELPTAGGSS